MPLEPFDRAMIRRGVRRFNLVALCAWIPLIVPTLLASLAVRSSDGMDLFILSIVLAMAAPLIVLIAVIFISIHWLPWFMHAIWSACDGEVGPWSRSTIKGRVFIVLLLAQLVAAAVIALVCFSLYPDWPAGWP